MTQPADPRLRQAARLLGVDSIDAASARDAFARDPAGLALGLVEEAAASDDVTSAASAIDYLETRLVYLGDLLDDATAAAVRGHFAEAVRGWGP
jgi:hypothetical protein